MGVLLIELMKMPSFKNAKLAAGKIDNTMLVEGITIIEAPDIANWIKGGELLLTSFYSIDKDIGAQITLVEKLYKKNAAALIVKTSRFLKEIPIEVINIGNKLGFPIIEILGETKYIDIMYPVMGEIFNEQVNRLNYYKKCHEQFTKLSLEMKGIFSVTKTLEKLVENPVIIFDRYYNPIAWNDEEFINIEFLNSNDKELVREDFSYYSLEVNFKGSIYTIIVEPIQVLNNIKGYLMVLEINRKMNDLDFIAFENAAITLRLEMLKDLAVTEVKLKYKGDLMDDLINGRLDSIQNVYERSRLLGWNLDHSFIVVIINISEYDNYIKKGIETNEGLLLIREKIKTIIDRVLYYYIKDSIAVMKGDNIIILWPIEKADNLNKTYNRIREFGNEVKRVILDKFGNITISVGIGGLSKNPDEIKRSYNEANDSLLFGNWIFENGNITIFDDLGIYKLLCKFENREQLIEFVHPGLLKLKDYNNGRNNELLDTLEMYLACDLNAVKTAAELFVHYKTVLYRLNRIRDLSNLEIDNRKKMLEIEIGLKILRVIK